MTSLVLRERLRDERGVTLMEIMVAIGIFAVVVAVTAQSLASFYVAIDVQEQRMEAVQACRAVLGALREKRAEFEDNFPADLLAWIEEKNDDGWNDFLKYDDQQGLRDHAIEVSCYDMEGDEADDTDDPLQVIVTSTWIDRRGRELNAQVVTALTGR